MIQQEELEVGKIYEVTGGQLNCAIWTGEEFRGPHKYANMLSFIEEKGYWEPLPLGVCKPIRKISDMQLIKPYDGVNLLRSMQALSEMVITW